MNCPRCGEVCSCQLEPVLAADSGEVAVAEPFRQESSGPPISQAETGPAGVAEAASENDDPSAWRDELADRLNRYRARRKMRPPRYPSLRLQFDAVPPLGEPVGSAVPPDAPPAFKPLSHRALALDDTAPYHCQDLDLQLRESTAEDEPRVEHAPTERPAPAHSGAEVSGAKISSARISGAKIASAKIIEFPRLAFEPAIGEPPVAPPDQLAEPVMDRPRILEVPELAPPPPALGGITIEPAQRQEIEKRPGIEIPLQSAALARRIFASLIDGLIIGAASALFGYIFWKVAAIRPPQAQILGLAIAIPSLFWAVYQYLLIVYAGSTPGLHAAGLALCRFDGSSTSRSLRRWRVLASYLSAASLGMGYAWVFLDEDLLCWHDRITHTYLGPKNRAVRQGVSVSYS
jgi:uncharacterized RDD family membrane protein YckC